MSANQLNFDSIKPARKVGKVYNYVTLPTFSYSGIIFKPTGSEIITQFNYSTTKNFILRNLPEQPANCNFVLCIKYRIGMTVYRYSLWRGLGEVMNNIEPYTSQIIKKNFVLEIWNIEGTDTVSLAEAIQIDLSIRSHPADVATIADIENDVGEENNIQNSQLLVPALPTTGLYGKYLQNDLVISGFNTVDQWNDSSGNNRHLTSVGTSRPSLTTGYVEFSGNDYLTYNPGQPFAMLGFYLVSQQSMNPASAYVLKNNTSSFETIIDFPDTTRFKIIKSDSSDFVYLQPVLNQLQVFWLRYDEATNKNYGGIDNLFASSEVGTFMGDDQATMQYLSLGDLSASAAADMKIYEILVYNSAITEAQHIQILQYLANKHSPGGFILQNQWNDGVPWLDNEE